MIGLRDIAGGLVVLDDGNYEVLEMSVWNGADYDAIWPTQDDGFGKLFEQVVDNGIVIGAKALFDLYIIQQEADDEANPPVAEVTKNISELLRHITLSSGADGTINFDRGIVSTGNITAGGLNGSDAIGNVLYRFDDSSWNAYNAATQAGWVPSMSFLRSEVLRLETMINSSPGGGGGTSNVSFTPVTTEYGTLGIDGATYQIRVWDNTSYLPKATWDSVFTVDATNHILSVISPYSLKVLNGSVTASGNITAGGIAASDVVNGVYYRLDDWQNYDDSGGTTDDYVPSAKIVYDWLSDLEDAISQGGGGSSNVSFTPISGGVYGVLTIDSGTPYNLLMYDANNPYLYKSVWDTVFTTNTTTHLLSLNSPYSFKVLNGSITASGNITAGTASADNELGAVYYRLDDWDNYTSATQGYVPAAGIVYPMLSRISAIETAIEEGVGSVNDVSIIQLPTGVSFTKTDTDGYINFSFSFDTGYSLLTAADKTKWDSIYDLFTVDDTYVQLNVKSGESVRDFRVIGSIKATQNITAGATASTEEIGDVLYRIDDWEDYDSTDQTDQESVPAMTLLDSVRNSVTLVAGQVATLAQTVNNLNLNTITDTLNTLVNTTIPNLTTSIATLAARNQFKYVGYGTPYADYPAVNDMEEGVLYIKLLQPTSL